MAKPDLKRAVVSAVAICIMFATTSPVAASLLIAQVDAGKVASTDTAWFQWGALGIVGATMAALLATTIPSLMKEVAASREAREKGYTDSQQRLIESQKLQAETASESYEAFSKALAAIEERHRVDSEANRKAVEKMADSVTQLVANCSARYARAAGDRHPS
jgi:hypothetical protein